MDPQYIDFGTLAPTWATDAMLVVRNGSDRVAHIAVALIGKLPDKESFHVAVEDRPGAAVFEIPARESVRLKVNYKFCLFIIIFHFFLFMLLLFYIVIIFNTGNTGYIQPNTARSTHMRSTRFPFRPW